jgi:hypothetical protein
LASLGLSQVRVEIAWNAGLRETQAPAWLPPGAALLYPGPNARDLHQLTPSERPAHLVVIDGTWHTAHTLYREKTWLQQLPHYQFSPATPSRYRLRREPHRDFVSTIEAIVEALRVLEPETLGLDHLLQAFDSMIDAQLAHVERRAGVPRNRKRRPLAERKMPHVLVNAFERLVVVYAETLRAHDDVPRELLQVTAVALATGAEFERLILPQSGPPSGMFLTYMRLQESDFSSASTLSDFRAAWSEFLGACGSSPLLAAWNQSTLDILAAATGDNASRVSFKSAYRGLHGTSARGLDEVIAKEGLLPTPLPFKGRAAQRLANAIAVGRSLHQHTRS